MEKSDNDFVKPVLLRGDCLELMADISDNSIDMVCCDMPYGTTNCKWDTTIDLVKLWEHYKRIAKDNAAIVLFAQTPFDKVLGCSNLDWLRYEIIWEKGTATGHLNAKRMPMKAHENVLVFYKRLPTYNPQKTTGHKPMNPVYESRKKSTEVYGDHITPANQAGATDRYPRSVLKHSVVTTGTLHPTQKPLGLIEWLIKTYSNEGDVVLDNCMGSGTTGMACKNLNRKFIGMELNENYFEAAHSRLSA